LLIATGLRRSELGGNCGLRWADYDGEACTLAVTGKVIRVSGEGLQRVDEPKFAVEMPQDRRLVSNLGQQSVIFPSTAGTTPRPEQLRQGVAHGPGGTGRPEVTTHSFRKTVATLIDEGLSARIGADHLCHSKASMTQDRYMTRGRVHTEVADLLDRTVAKR
jgi:integrase